MSEGFQSNIMLKSIMTNALFIFATHVVRHNTVKNLVLFKNLSLHVAECLGIKI
jgi:hypothetical protein